MMPSIRSVGRYLETPVPATALAVFRIIFGLLLFVDLIIERGWADQRIYSALKDTVDNKMCSFPLFDFLPRLTPELFGLLCGIQAVAALCISAGLLYRFSCSIFAATFWYLLLANKLRWNNHSYLFGILVTLMTTTSAHHKFSLDSLLLFRGRPRRDSVPYWNYFLPQIQIAIVYTYAGINKIDVDWLNGRPLPYLSEHWIFAMLKNLISSPWFDFVVIRLAGLVIDLLSGVALFHRTTRPMALIFTTTFHIMNSQMFSIGVFPAVMLAANLLFLPNYTLPPPINNSDEENSTNERPEKTSQFRRYAVTIFVGFHVLSQICIPHCHAFFPGLITWSKTGQYGFSWEMMLHEWNVAHITVNLKDKHTGEDLYLDADKLVPGGQRWKFHPDMIFQFSNCVARMLIEDPSLMIKSPREAAGERYSLYIDTWLSLNQRVHQRLVDPHTDFFNASWSPFKKPEWMLSLIETLPRLNSANLLETLNLKLMGDMNRTEYLIFADFPGYSLHHFIDPALENVQLFVLNGSVSVTFDDDENEDKIRAKAVELKVGDDPLSIHNGQFHTLKTTSDIPTLCLYAFVNSTFWNEVDRRFGPGTYVPSEPDTTTTATPSNNGKVSDALSSVTSRVSGILKNAKGGFEISERAFRTLAFGERFLVK